jgi:glycosyltransferase involved in cell wall biosynthesis
MPFHGPSSRRTAKSADPKIIFVGTMNYHPNVDAVRYFVEQIFPLVRLKFPRAVFEIVGRDPPKAITRLKRLDGVTVIGEVPDIRAFLIRADVSVAPMRIARGVQNKVLEAMAMGVPVVGTPAAIQGIEVHDGQEVLVGNDPEEFARQVIRLLSDAELRKTITKRAWMKMKQLYNWESVGARLEALLNAEPVTEARGAGDSEVSIGRR